MAASATANLCQELGCWKHPRSPRIDPTWRWCGARPDSATAIKRAYSRGPQRTFARIGVPGQAIHIDPASGLIMVHTAVHRRADDPNLEAMALWRDIVDAIDRQRN